MKKHYEKANSSGVRSVCGNTEGRLTWPLKDGNGWINGEVNCPECVFYVDFGEAPYLVAIDKFLREAHIKYHSYKDLYHE